jgi:hypothetical protein
VEFLCPSVPPLAHIRKIRKRMSLPKFRVGDRIVNTAGVVREILAVRETGYSWRYPNSAGSEFTTENTDDPLCEWWMLHQAEEPGA